METRLAMLDVDGTLMHEGAWYEGSRELITALADAGIAVALCSGRAIDSLRATAADVPGVTYLAGAGGSVVQARDGDGWRPIGDRALPVAVVDEVMRLTTEAGMEVWAYTHDAWLVAARTPRVEFDESFTHTVPAIGEIAGRDDVVKLLLFCEDETQQAVRDEVATWDGIGVASSYPGYWDVLPAASLATKGGDLLTGAMGIGWEQVLAAGDGGNDLGMLSRAGRAYALAPRSVDELSPATDGQVRRAVAGIADVLADLRRDGTVA